MLNPLPTATQLPSLKDEAAVDVTRLGRPEPQRQSLHFLTS